MTVAEDWRTPDRTRLWFDRHGWLPHLDKAEHRGGPVSVACLVHGDKDGHNFSLWPDGNWKSHCSKCLVPGGNVIDLVMVVDGVPLEDALSLYKGDEDRPRRRISTAGITGRVPQAQATATPDSARGERPRDQAVRFYPYRLADSPQDAPVWHKRVDRSTKPRKSVVWGRMTDGKFAVSSGGLPPRYWYTHALERYAGILPAGEKGVTVRIATGERAPADRRLWVVEGEECADLLGRAGLCGTTGANGSESFNGGVRGAMAAFLRQWPAGVVILPDANSVGEKYARNVAQAAHAAGVPVSIVRLPGLADGEDVLDWAWNAGHLPDEGYCDGGPLDAGAILRGLLEAAGGAEPWEPSPEDKAQGPAAPAFRIMSCADLAAAKSEAPRHVFGMRDGTPVIGAGVILLGAPPKIGKSWITLELAYSMATGAPAFGLLYPEGTDDSSVIYVNSDRQSEGQVLAHRQAAILDGRAEPENIDWFVADGDAPMPQDEALVSAVLERVKQRRNTRLVVIDTLTAATGPATKRGDLQALELAQVLRWKAITSLGPSVILVKHSPKLVYQDIGSNFAGSNGLLAGVDQALYLERKRDAKAAALVVLGGRTGIASSVELEASDSGRFAGKQIHHGAPRGSMEDRDKVRELAAIHPSGITANLVAAALEKQHNTATQLLVRMTKAGELRSVSRGVYALP